jgi:hypothetical protein
MSNRKVFLPSSGIVFAWLTLAASGLAARQLDRAPVVVVALSHSGWLTRTTLTLSRASARSFATQAAADAEFQADSTTTTPMRSGDAKKHRLCI